MNDYCSIYINYVFRLQREWEGSEMNHVSLIGRLTKDVDLRYTSSGIAVGNFNLAVNKLFTNEQGERDADFIQCQIWRKSAENLANFTKKGSRIGVEGRINTRNYENNEGQRVYVTEVIVNQFYLLDPRDNSQVNQAQNQTGNTQNQQEHNYSNNQNNVQNDAFLNDIGAKPIDISEEDLPF